MARGVVSAVRAETGLTHLQSTLISTLIHCMAGHEIDAAAVEADLAGQRTGWRRTPRNWACRRTWHASWRTTPRPAATWPRSTSTADDLRAFSLLAMVISLFETGSLPAAAGLFEASPCHLSQPGMAARFADAYAAPRL